MNKNKDQNHNQAISFSMYKIRQEINHYTGLLIRKEKIKSTHKLIELFGQISLNLDRNNSDQDYFFPDGAKSKVNEDNILIKLSEQFKEKEAEYERKLIEKDNEFKNINKLLNVAYSENEKLLRINDNLHQKIEDLMEGNSEKENKLIKAEVKKLELNTRKKVDREAEKEMKKLAKEEAKFQVELETLTQSNDFFEYLRESLRDYKSDCPQLKIFHSDMIDVVDGLQIHMDILANNAIISRSHYEMSLLKIQKLTDETNYAYYIAQQYRDFLDEDTVENEVLTIKKAYDSQLNFLENKIFNEVKHHVELDALREMPIQFRSNMKIFKQKLEVLLINIDLAKKFKLIESWIENLKDFVGKSVGESEKIEALILRKS